MAFFVVLDQVRQTIDHAGQHKPFPVLGRHVLREHDIEIEQGSSVQNHFAVLFRLAEQERGAVAQLADADQSGDVEERRDDAQQNGENDDDQRQQSDKKERAARHD